MVASSLLFHCFIKLFYSEYIMQCRSTCVTFYLTLTITLLTKYKFCSAIAIAYNILASILYMMLLSLLLAYNILASILYMMLLSL